MRALAPVSNWMPEDDLLLRKAVEAGASLESLAKGAVKFSRKYSLAELKDRWRSLLYNPVVSTTQFNFNRTGNIEETKAFPTKRNNETVRSRYHALCKRMRVEPFDAFEDLNYMVGLDDAGYMEDAEEFLFGDGILDDGTLNSFQFEESHLETFSDDFPEILENIPQTTSADGSHMRFDEVVTNVPENFSFTGSGTGLDQQLPDFQLSQVLSSPIPEFGPPVFEDLNFLSQVPSTAKQMNEENPPSDFLLDIPTEEKDLREDHDDCKLGDTPESVLLSDVPEDPILVNDCYFAELSRSLFDEEDTCMDEDGKAAIDKSYYDLLLNSSNDAVSGNQENMAGGTLVVPFHKDVTGDVPGMGVDNDKGSYLNVSPRPALDPHPEIQNRLIICLLNSESDEIPDNDHLPIDPSPPTPNLSSKQRNIKAQNSIPASASELADKKPGKPPLRSRSVTPQAVYMKTGQPKPVGECCIKSKLPRSNGLGKSNIAGLGMTGKNTDVPSTLGW